MKIAVSYKDVVDFLSLFMAPEKLKKFSDGFSIKDNKAIFKNNLVYVSFTVSCEDGCIVMDIGEAKTIVIGGFFGKIREVAGNLIIKQINALPIKIVAKKQKGNIYVSIEGLKFESLTIKNNEVSTDITVL